MNQQSFFKGLSYLLILNLIIKPIWIFFIDRQVQVMVGNEAYGIYFSILNLSLVLFFLADAGFTNMINQHIANRQPVHFYQLLQIKLCLLMLYAAVFLFIAWLSHIPQKDILFSVLTIQVLTSLYIFARSIVTANQFYYTDSLFSILDKMMMIIFCSGFIYGHWFAAFTLTLFLHLQIISTLIAVLIAFSFIVSKNLLHSHKKDNTETLFKKTFPFAIIIFLMSVHNRLDGFLLQQLHHNGASEAGIYASGYRLLDAANMAGYMAASFLVPYISRHNASKKIIIEAIDYTRNGLMTLGICLFCFTIIFIDRIQQLLYHNSDLYQSHVIFFCFASLPAYYLIQVYGSVLTATSRFWIFIRILFFSALINIILNTLLIPSYGAAGCCTAALASQYFCGIAAFLVTSRILQLRIHLKTISFYFFTLASSLLVFYLSNKLCKSFWIIISVAIIFTFLIFLTQYLYLKKVLKTTAA